MSVLQGVFEAEETKLGNRLCYANELTVGLSHVFNLFIMEIYDKWKLAKMKVYNQNLIWQQMWWTVFSARWDETGLYLPAGVQPGALMPGGIDPSLMSN